MMHYSPKEVENRKQQWLERQRRRPVVKYTMIDTDLKYVMEGPTSDGELYYCPCCLYKTLSERGAFEICDVCFWEDDGQDEADTDSVWGGPNGKLSLTQARQNYLEIGACQARLLEYVRPPKLDEI